MRIAVVIASTQRPEILADTLVSLHFQSRPADEILVSVVHRSDLPADMAQNVRAVFSERGASKQRNAGLSALSEEPTFVAFLDDDIILHPDYLQRMAAAFEAWPDAALIMGRLLANGNISPDQARNVIASAKPDDHYSIIQSTFGGVYGCNMCVRFDVAQREPFDERLPLYSLMEDMDFGTRVRRYGHIGYYHGSLAVHLRAHGGRVSHRALGFSEVMNPVYLAVKGTVPFRHALCSFVIKKPLVNFARATLPGRRRAEYWRRLLGNLEALGLIAARQLYPEYAVAIEVNDISRRRIQSKRPVVISRK